MTDGPNGVKERGSLIGGLNSAAFLIGITLGATFDVALVHGIGEALAEEVNRAGPTRRTECEHEGSDVEH